MRQTYLGDGLYAAFDGWSIILKAPREDGEHWIVLEPDTYEALVEFVSTTMKAKQEEK